MSTLAPELVAHARTLARQLGVDAALHDQDFILHFLLDNPCFHTKAAAIDYYFHDGRKSAAQLAQLIFGELELDRAAERSMLEFASGYGCVTRHLAAALEPWEVVSSDIHPAANAFNAANFGRRTVQSTTRPEDFPQDRKFTVVFALSFFSHMPAATWSRWLVELFGLVEDGGFLVFTTQGMASRKFLGSPQIPEDGFWFNPASEQVDLRTDDYGQTIVTVPYVLEQVRRVLPDAYPRVVRPGHWWAHQDVFVVGRVPQGS